MDKRIIIYYDNLNSIQISRNLVYHAGNLVYHAETKHIEVHYHFIREGLLVGDNNLVYNSMKGRL